MENLFRNKGSSHSSSSILTEKSTTVPKIIAVAGPRELKYTWQGTLLSEQGLLLFRDSAQASILTENLD